ncbi:MAG: methyltransferase domain-containing protein [Actinobacteria bacterium]|jgi:SAM-dependent methyltransferase|nr:methyltransferase domain-containing protein [Actinomycetota bacterium]
MHQSSFEKMQVFVNAYLHGHTEKELRILDFGSQVVDEQAQSYKQLFAFPTWEYIGVDLTSGINVDYATTDPYDWSVIDSESMDVVISGQVFEHIPFFWVSIFEIMRIIKPGGLACLIAPSSGGVHKFPVDCWRFYEDGFIALASYVGAEVIDSFTDHKNGDWADSIIVFKKPLWSFEQRNQFAQRHHHQMAVIGRQSRISKVEENMSNYSLLAASCSAGIAECLQKRRERSIGKLLPTRERFRRSINELLGQWLIERLIRAKSKLKLGHNAD